MTGVPIIFITQKVYLSRTPSALYPDPDWIRFLLGLWFYEGKNDPKKIEGAFKKINTGTVYCNFNYQQNYKWQLKYFIYFWSSKNLDLDPSSYAPKNPGLA
jgi:hypothetical protein